MDWVENKPSRGLRLRASPREIWAHREVARALIVKQLRLRYAQTLLGVGWAVAQPVVTLAIFGVVFGRLIHVESEGLPYLTFAYSGLVIWSFVSTATTAAATGVVDNIGLVTRVYFPRVLVVVAATLPWLVDLLVGLVLLGILMIVQDVEPSWAIVTLPLWVAAAVLLAFAVGLWLAPLNALYRDVRLAFTFLVQAWFFASPVIFPASLVDESWRTVYALNPAVGLIDGTRWALVGADAPPAGDLASLLGLVVLLASGAAYFSSAERTLPDRV
jgi:lipopolysaccharide transport system permease protein